MDGKGKCINHLKGGCRVWAELGLRDHGHNKANVPAKTGGSVISTRQEFYTIDQLLYTVKWDSGQESVHYGNELHCIGQCRSLTEFEALIHTETIHIKQTLGPNGGKRGLVISLRNGDWIEDYYSILPELEQKGIPIETERLPRTPRLRR